MTTERTFDLLALVADEAHALRRDITAAKTEAEVLNREHAEMQLLCDELTFEGMSPCGNSCDVMISWLARKMELGLGLAASPLP